MQKIEYIVWGKQKGQSDESILLTQIEGKQLTRDEAHNAVRILESKYGCTECRVQEIDLTTKPNFLNTIQ